MKSDFFAGRKIAITGGAGFLAGHLAPALKDRGANVTLVLRRPWESEPPAGMEVRVADLRRRDEALAALEGHELVFHLAAVGWGFHENARRQPELLTENLLLNTTVIDAAHRVGARGLLFASSSAVYPAELELQDEEAPLDGPPHEGEAGFAWAKRMGELQARAYHRHHGFPVAIVRPSNPYGPGEGRDPAKAHVIPALIHRALRGERPFTVWGTGRPLRTFLHARDVARGMLLAMEKATDARPVNLASAREVSVGELAAMVLAACGRKDEAPVFDTTKPDGPLRRRPALARTQALGFDETVSLEEGLAGTVAWFRKEVMP